MRLLDKEYLREHLKYYIEFQLKQGYDLLDIKEALIKYGYTHKFVEEVSHHAKPQEVEFSLLKPSREELDEDAYQYILNMLIDYMMKEHKQGYSLQAIKKALVKSGHLPSIVNDAAQRIQKGVVVDYQQPLTLSFKVPPSIILGVCLLLVFGALFTLSVATNASIVIILFNFIPTFVGVLILYLLLVFISWKGLRKLLPLISIVVTLAFFIILLQYSTLIRTTQMHIVLILNVLLTFICSLLYSVFAKMHEEPLLKKVSGKSREKPHEAGEKKTSPISPISDTSKAAITSKSAPHQFPHKGMVGGGSEAQKFLAKAGISHEEDDASLTHAKEKRAREMP